ncbi:MAG: DNA repair protein RecO [Chitinophagaceae bacterium]|nr:DNA repair protein RecO [Chitinophagaceae bacterium]
MPVLHKTKGIVLRSVRYGETSLVVTIYTELFGIQSYMVNGVRTSSAKTARAGLFQPSVILDMVVYHHEQKNLQRIKEFRWGYLYRQVFSDVRKNSVALFMIELLQKCLKQPEPNAGLFHFVEDSLVHLDEADAAVTANFPLFFALHLTAFFGFRFSDDYSEKDTILDLQEGEFVHDKPHHPHFLEGGHSYITSQLLKVMQPHELTEIKLNQEARRVLLHAYETYYALHVPDFGTLKSLPVLKEILA